MTKSNRILHLSLFTVSTYMSVMMFILIGNDLISKIALALLALIFELTKLSDLHKIQSDVKAKVIYITSYGLKAILSVIASVGLVMTLLSAQGDASGVLSEIHNSDLKSYDAEVSYWEKEIQLLDETVKLLNENLARNPEGYGISGKTFVNQIQAVQATKKDYREKYQAAVEDRLTAITEASMETIEVNPGDMFTEIGSVLRIDARKLKVLVFSLIMILVEVSLALTGLEPGEVRLKSPVKLVNPSTSEKPSSPVKSDYKKSVKDEIIRQQASREKNDMKLFTQNELAEKLGTTVSNVNNSIRRHIKPMMQQEGFSSYLELYKYLKKSS